MIRWVKPKDALPSMHPELKKSVTVLVWNHSNGTDAGRLIVNAEGRQVWQFGERTFAGLGYADLWAYVPAPAAAFALFNAADRPLILAAPEQQAKIDILLDACHAALDFVEGRGVRDGYVEDARVTVRRKLSAAITEVEGAGNDRQSEQDRAFQ